MNKKAVPDPACIWAVKVGMLAALFGITTLAIGDNFFYHDFKPFDIRDHMAVPYVIST